MPYFITDQSPDCAGWATVTEDGEVYGCHQTKQDAVDQMVALSIAEDMEPQGEMRAPAPPDHPRSTRTLGGNRITGSVPEYIKSAASKGLEYNRDGFSGDGLTDQTIREARLMASGQVSDDKIIRANAWVPVTR